jgi:hypothetical protein
LDVSSIVPPRTGAAGYDRAVRERLV